MKTQSSEYADLIKLLAGKQYDASMNGSWSSGFTSGDIERAARLGNVTKDTVHQHINQSAEFYATEFYSGIRVKGILTFPVFSDLVVGMPTASDLKKKIVKGPTIPYKDVKAEEARLRTHAAVVEVIAGLKGHIAKLESGTEVGEYQKERFYMNLPWGAYGDDFKPFLNAIRRELGPLGYTVEIGHDGVGIHNTAEITW